MKRAELRLFLDEKVKEFNRPSFIADDPISVPHAFSIKEDIEISAFLCSLIAWGRRDIILRSAHEMMRRMENQPYAYLMQSRPSSWKQHLAFVHRTFNGQDFVGMLHLLRHIYTHCGGLETVFTEAIQKPGANAYAGISALREVALSLKAFPFRSRKHLPDPEKGASAKRMNMFLRWMVRQDARGVDFGIWTRISASRLICPLDVHTGRVARLLGLLSRNTDDRKAAEALTAQLAKWDALDPVKYDFALFGLGVSGTL